MQFPFVDKFVGFVRENQTHMVRRFDKYKLESELASILKKYKGHRTNNTPRASEIYRLLWTKADKAIKAYCVKHNIPESEVYTQIPAMNAVHEWGQPVAQATGRRLSTLSAYVFAGGGVVFATGFGCVVFAQVFHWGGHAAHYLLRLI